jgi:geranylgeranyl reductase family protein
MIRIVETPRLDADVIIVGGGPAGAALAFHLRKNGHNVIILEASQFPRDKVCGDFVGPVALKELEGMGILDEFQSSNIINRSGVFLNGEMLIEQELPEVEGLPNYGRVITRMELDHKMYNRAIEVGAIGFENTRVLSYTVRASHVEVKAKHNGKAATYKSKVLIGADGSNSTIARQLNGKKHPKESKILAVRAYYDNVSGPEDRADLFFTEGTFPGYYWLFPTGKKQANIGVGMVMETLPKSEKHLKEMLDELIVNDPALSDRMKKGKLVGKVEGWPLSTYDPDLDFCEDRVLLIGDAAGLINSLNGEGIQYATLSGRWASEVLHSALTQNDFSKETLSDFAVMVKREIGYDLALSRVVIQGIRNRNLNPLWMEMLQVIIQRASYDPAYAKIAGGILAGVVPANEVVHPGFLMKTALQTGFYFGGKAAGTLLGGVNKIRKVSSGAIEMASQLGRDVINEPDVYGNWTWQLTKDLTHMAKYTLTDMQPKILSKYFNNNGKKETDAPQAVAKGST